MERILMKGNEAVGEAAIRAGCRFFFGYPITPQNEIPEYMARRLPEVGGVFLQAESELSAINMVYGAAGAGARVMTSSSSPGISLKQEGISYLAGSELPCVIVNMVRGGPGLGDIQPAQSDYFQATKGGGHGDYHLLVLAPSSIQELVDLTFQAFDLADRYRNPVLILGDGMLGQMMEPVVLPPFRTEPLPPKPWATTGAGKGPRRVINSLHMDPARLEEHNWHLAEKYRAMEREVKWEEVGTEGAEVVLVAYGTAARVAKAAAAQATALGIKTGLLRPLTLFPFPYEAVRRLAERVRLLLAVELSTGQMVEDVRLGAEGRCPVRLYGRPGGQVPTPQDVVEAIQREGRR